MEQRTADLELGFPQQRGYNKSQTTYLGIASQRGNILFNVQLKCSGLSYVMPQKKKHTNSTEITTAAQHTESQEGTQAL